MSSDNEIHVTVQVTIQAKEPAPKPKRDVCWHCGNTGEDSDGGWCICRSTWNSASFGTADD